MRSKKVVFPVFTAATLGFALAAYGCQGEMHIGDQAKAPTASTTAAPPPVTTTAAPTPPPVDTPPPAPPPKAISLKGVSSIKGSQIQLPGDVEFGSGSDQIIMNDKSKAVLNAVLKILTDNPSVTKMRIEGHTDNQGSAAYNQGLSERRAASVVKWLVTNKIDPARIHSVGLGPKCPLGPNDTAANMAANRRTEFHLEQMDGTPVAGDATDSNGCSAAAPGAAAAAPTTPAASASGAAVGGAAPKASAAPSSTAKK